MPTLGNHVRRLKALDQVIRIESLKPADKRVLDLDKLLESARSIDKFAVEQP